MRRKSVGFLAVTCTLLTTGCDDYTIAEKAKVDACAAGVVLKRRTMTS